MADCIVLGAGIVGVSVAVHLQMRGRATVLVDRRGPGEETSHGNAGQLQREGVMPYAFPRDFAKLFSYAQNNRIDMHYHAMALPRLAPFLVAYASQSRRDRYLEIVRTYAPLIAASLSEHEALIEKAGASALIEKRGWLRLYRTQQALDLVLPDVKLAETYGVEHRVLSGKEMRALEPGLAIEPAGGIHWLGPWSTNDPGGLVRAYARLFESLGGQIVRGDALTLDQHGGGWRVATSEGRVDAPVAVVALGPWASDVTRRLGYHLPLAVKRGYHMHYAPAASGSITRAVQDAEVGYMLAPMQRGIRLTTGAEFADRDAPPTPVQLRGAEAAARELLPLGERLDDEPWMGLRPCTPDMMPIIGAAPKHKGLYFTFGHAHHGLTLGPVTGRLIAEEIAGERPFLDIQPFSPARFLG